MDLSKFLSWLLRHGLEEYNLEYDEEGWVHVEELLNHEKFQSKKWDYWAMFEVASNKADPGKIVSRQWQSSTHGVRRCLTFVLPKVIPFL